MRDKEPSYEYAYFRACDLPDGTRWRCRVVAVERGRWFAQIALRPLGRDVVVLLLCDPDETLPDVGELGWMTFRHYERPRGHAQAHWLYSKEPPK